MTASSVNAGVRLALATIREHKMRSFLTVLGVIIGTGAVIGVGSIIAGLDAAITNILRSFGPDTIIVFKGRAMGHWTPRGSAPQAAHARERRWPSTERCPSVLHASPYLFPGPRHP